MRPERQESSSGEAKSRTSAVRGSEAMGLPGGAVPERVGCILSISAGLPVPPFPLLGPGMLLPVGGREPSGEFIILSWAVAAT